MSTCQGLRSISSVMCLCVLECVWGAGEEGGGVEIFADILD